MATPNGSSGQRRRAATAAQTRRRIIHATRDLVPTAGTSLPVAEIARVAGVALQTIYDHFGSKGGLLMATVADVQRSMGLFDAFGAVFHSPDGETAMRRMIAATVGIWHRAWPFVEFTIRARRSDPVVAAEMDKLDRLRFVHFEAIVQRLEEEGRLRAGASVAAAAAEAFALSTATVYEELAVRRAMDAESAIDAVTRAVFGAILQPGTAARDVPPPDWPTLEAAAALRAGAAGAPPDRLDPSWFGSGAAPAGEPPAVKPAGRPPGRIARSRS